MQITCKSVKGPFPCSEDPKTEAYSRLKKWDGFKGCNNLTEGYQEGGYIYLKVCSCGGIM